MFGEDYNRAVTSGDTLLIRGTIRGQRGRHPGAQWYAHYRLNTDKKCLLVSLLLLVGLELNYFVLLPK